MTTTASGVWRVSFSHVDPYTWEIKKEVREISIAGNEQNVRNWVKQTYYKAMVFTVTKCRKRKTVKKSTR